ncbi:MAG: leucine-rich repeat protein [Treponema sp.]|jgi:Leucine-rich repeat (LRR) protein|nr:leucine-rich repeat protein [Treponema sp.]
MKAMKRKIGILMIIASVMALFASCFLLENYDDENDFIIAVHVNTIEITGYRGTKTDINIPPRIQKMPVTAIGKRAFAEKKLTGVKIPKGVKYIWNRAFWGNKIEHIIIPETVTKIEYGAFAYNKIKEIVLPSGITEIGYEMFKNNELTGITIPESVTTIGESAFENNRFTEIVIPVNVTSIGSNAFGSDNPENNDRNNITKITIGDSVELDKYAIKNQFSQFYKTAVREKGGTYIYSDDYWQPVDKTIPVYRFLPGYGWKSPDITFLLDMPDLEEVDLGSNDLLTDITPLAGLTKIERLYIYDCPKIENIKPLSSLVNLEYLFLTHNDNYDYNVLAPLPNLDHFSLFCYYPVELDLGSVGRLHYLRSLRFGNTNIFKRIKTKNINELHNLSNLEKLEILGVTDLDLLWIFGLHDLIELTLDNCTVKDLIPLANLPNLVEVHLEGCNIKDITPLLRSNSIKHVVVFNDIKGGISDNTRSLFKQKGIELDIF